MQKIVTQPTPCAHGALITYKKRRFLEGQFDECIACHDAGIAWTKELQLLYRPLSVLVPMERCLSKSSQTFLKDKASGDLAT